MTAPLYNKIALQPDGEGKTLVSLGDTSVYLVTKYNYSAFCWMIDILDADEIVLLSGQMLVPNVDILAPYPDIKDLIGSLILVELNLDDYKSSDLLGINTALLWYAPGVIVTLP